MTDFYMSKNKGISELDLQDKLILYELSRNSRQGIRSIGRKIKKSPQFVEYRIKKLDKYISQYPTVIGYEHLGYTTMMYYLELNGSNKDIEKIVNMVTNKPQINVVIQTQGQCDLIVGTLFKTTEDIFVGIKDLHRQFGDNIRSLETSIHVGASYFGHRYILPEKVERQKIPVTGGWMKQKIPIKMTDKKNKVLKILAANSQVTYKQIANDVKCSEDTARYMVKKMEQEKLIEKYSIIPSNPNNYRVMIKLSNADEKIVDKFREYGKKRIETIQVVRTIGKYSLLFDVYAEKPYILRDWINNLRTELGEHILEYTYINLWNIKRLAYYQVDVNYLKA